MEQTDCGANKRGPGRPKKEKGGLTEYSTLIQGKLTGNAAKLYDVLHKKGLGIEAALRLLAKSDYAALFFKDMALVREINAEESPGIAPHQNYHSSHATPSEHSTSSPVQSRVETNNVPAVGDAPPSVVGTYKEHSDKPKPISPGYVEEKTEHHASVADTVGSQKGQEEKGEEEGGKVKEAWG